MRKDIANLKHVFSPKSIAVIGASGNPAKLGNVILKNLVEGRFGGKLYPINPNYKELLGLKCYNSITEIKGKVDLAIFAVPAKITPKIAETCGKKGVKGIVVLSAGFGESGEIELEMELKRVVEKYKIAMVGPNCLGVMNPEKRVDSIFFPFYKFERPKAGGVSLITQSGAVGSCIADLAAHYDVGFAKFVSYGNGATINDADLLEYLGGDKKTEQILFYLEGTKNGKKLLKMLEKVNAKKPVIVLKAGKGKNAGEAAKSHTGNLAGNYLAYNAVFRESKAIEVNSVVELFRVVNMFSQPLPKGKRVGILTDGGGLGVLSMDALEQEGLVVAKFGEKMEKQLEAVLPKKIRIANPLDIIADSGTEVYETALRAFMEEDAIDTIVVIILFQAPAVDSRIIDVLIKESDKRKKPIVVVAVGGNYTMENRKILGGYGIPTYGCPFAAIQTLRRVTDYALFRRSIKR